MGKSNLGPAFRPGAKRMYQADGCNPDQQTQASGASIAHMAPCTSVASAKVGAYGWQVQTAMSSRFQPTLCMHNRGC